MLEVYKMSRQNGCPQEPLPLKNKNSMFKFTGGIALAF
jgi:hypothetical protein